MKDVDFVVDVVVVVFVVVDVDVGDYNFENKWFCQSRHKFILHSFF